MPGPTPKDPSTRQRRNRTTTAAVLRAVPDAYVPELPKRGGWHEMTVAWWNDLWTSPMAPEFDASDMHGLYQLALLIDDFWLSESVADRIKLASELRQQSQRFGLSPIDRRRLQWEIERTEEAQEKGARRRSSASPRSTSKGDPRSTLRSL